MTLYKVQHDKDNPFTVLNCSIAQDKRVSYRSMGIWLYAFSKKGDWQFYKQDLINQHKEGRYSVEGGLAELEETGYLYRFRRQNKENGQFDGWEWTFFETSKTKEEIQKMFPKHRFSDDRVTRISEESAPITNKEFVANKKDNNSRGAAEPSVAVFSCLENLEIEDAEKEWITSHYASMEPHVIECVAWVTHESTTIKETFIQALKWACSCKTPPQIKPSLCWFMRSCL